MLGALTLAALLAACARAAEAPYELVEQRGHALSVDAVALSADGRLAATAGKDGQAILWDARAGHVLRALRAEPLGVAAVALSKDSARLLTAGAGTAELWDVKTGRLLRRFGRPGEFLAAARFWPDDAKVLTAGGDGVARVWNAADGRLLRQYETEAPRLSDAAGSADGAFLVAAAGGAEVSVFEGRTGRLLRVLAAGGAALRVAVSADGKLAAAGGEDSVWVWDLADGRPRASFKAPASRGLAFAPDGRTLLTCGGASTARVWTLDGQPVRALIGHADAVRALALSGDGKLALTGSDDRSARLWDTATGAELRALSGAPARALHALASADGRRLVTVDEKTARLWDLDRGALVAVTTGDFSAAGALSVSADGRLLAWLRDREMVDLKDLAAGRDLGTFQWNLLRADALSLDADGRTLATARESTVQLWDPASLSPRPGAPPPGARVNRLWSGLSGRRLLYLDAFGALRLWSVDARREVAAWPARGAAPPDVAVAPGGRAAATAERSDGGVVLSVRSLEDGKLLAGWDDAAATAPYALDPDAKRLLLVGDGAARTRDLAAGSDGKPWRAPQGTELSWPQAVDPGWRWAAAAADGDVLFLSLADGAPLARLTLTETGWVARAPDGRYDASDAALRWTRGAASLPSSAHPDPRRVPGLLSRLLRGR